MVIIKMNHKLLSKNNFAGKKSQHPILNHVSSEQNNCIRNWYGGPKYWSDSWDELNGSKILVRSVVSRFGSYLPYRSELTRTLKSDISGPDHLRTD